MSVLFHSVEGGFVSSGWCAKFRGAHNQAEDLAHLRTDFLDAAAATIALQVIRSGDPASIQLVRSDRRQRTDEPTLIGKGIMPVSLSLLTVLGESPSILETDLAFSNSVVTSSGVCIGNLVSLIRSGNFSG
jgi:hypothetical protein